MGSDNGGRTAAILKSNFPDDNSGALKMLSRAVSQNGQHNPADDHAVAEHHRQGAKRLAVQRSSVTRGRRGPPSSTVVDPSRLHIL